MCLYRLKSGDLYTLLTLYQWSNRDCARTKLCSHSNTSDHAVPSVYAAHTSPSMRIEKVWRASNTLPFPWYYTMLLHHLHTTMHEDNIIQRHISVKVVSFLCSQDDWSFGQWTVPSTIYKARLLPWSKPLSNGGDTESSAVQSISVYILPTTYTKILFLDTTLLNHQLQPIRYNQALFISTLPLKTPDSADTISPARNRPTCQAPPFQHPKQSAASTSSQNPSQPPSP